MKSSLAYLLLLIVISTEVFSAERIKALRFDKSKVETVYVSPGMATVMLFPCDIEEAVVGREQDIKAIASLRNPRQLNIFLSSPLSSTTNLIVRCGRKSDLFVFDLTSNKSKHQDVLKVSSFYGQPEMAGDKEMFLVDSSEMQKKKSRKTVIEVSPPILIEESK